MITEFGGIVQLVKNIWLTSRRSVVRIHLPLQKMHRWHSWLAQQIFNLWVLGSSPSRCTIFINKITSQLSLVERRIILFAMVTSKDCCSEELLRLLTRGSGVQIPQRQQIWFCSLMEVCCSNCKVCRQYYPKPYFKNDSLVWEQINVRFVTEPQKILESGVWCKGKHMRSLLR